VAKNDIDDSDYENEIAEDISEISNVKTSITAYDQSQQIDQLRHVMRRFLRRHLVIVKMLGKMREDMKEVSDGFNLLLDPLIKEQNGRKLFMNIVVRFGGILAFIITILSALFSGAFQWHPR
jgi:hypothetical protein